jgi:hypothetical protein
MALKIAKETKEVLEERKARKAAHMKEYNSSITEVNSAINNENDLELDIIRELDKVRKIDEKAEKLKAYWKGYAAGFSEGLKTVIDSKEIFD